MLKSFRKQIHGLIGNDTSLWMQTNNTLKNDAVFYLKERRITMPETKFQDFIYTLIMAFVMVYAMVCYNIAIHTGGLSNFVFIEAFKELPLMWPAAIILEFFLIGKIAHKLTFKALDPKKTPAIIISYGISIVIVSFMCPIMSLIATIFINSPSLDTFISSWLQAMVLSFPMALCFQLFYAGPLVRFIFRTIFKNKLSKKA